MKHLLLLITLLVMVTRAEAERQYYFVDLKLITQAYEGLTCQQGLDTIQKVLQDDDSKKVGERGKLKPYERGVYQACRAKLVTGQNSNLSTGLNNRLLAVLTDQPNCRCPDTTPKCRGDDLLILRLEPDVFAKWTKQLGTQLTKTGSTEPKLLEDLLNALNYALSDRCNYVRK